eukprot:Blabericola_migrator_1__3204@NODE_1942_length_3530_cov_792_035518_g1238_i1_p1_GENE_NODE_1942_length_3530_cov_792_035518_g1238_i1NODE_1942_length_3530_cov_792_035518_g1238_i1_p1_ORF_typecomplete_len997_score215_90Prominin/PF05478_11/4_5e02Prominin/PF05478_11/0_0068MFS_Mycoplasma/PF07672_13/1_7MFS_Mycoplasma/PF07672_13/1_1e02Srg/PF02118_21/0_2Srg/PF02118_21/2_3e03_NODE_1942_length_3530_cov_792_035518_g1238_i13053295
MVFERPENFDYSSWRADLEDHVQSACGNTWRFKGPSWTFSETVFRNLQDSEASGALESYMLKESSMGHYLKYRSGFVFMLVLGIVLLIAAILTTLAVNPKVRKFYSHLFCGSCRGRDRPKLNSIQQEVRRRMLWVIGCSSIIVIGLVTFQIVITSRMLVDVKKVDCGVWMQLYGHFYGVDSLDKDELNEVTREIAWNWRGTIPLLDAIKAIDSKVDPSLEDNPLRAKLWAGYETLKTDAAIQSEETNRILTDWMTMSKTWYEIGDGLSAGYTKKNGTWTEFMVGTANAVAYKAEVFSTELATTLKTGYTDIEGLLETYAGTNSELLSKAKAATDDSASTINQMNAIIGSLTEKWNHLGPKLMAALRAIAGLIISVCIIAFGISPVCIVLAGALRSHMITGESVSSKGSKLWCVSFVIVAILAGACALFSGLTFLLIGIGNDACDVLEDGVFERGQWAMLGDDILHPEGVTDIDTQRVLDTCVKTSGDGNIASGLALDARIAELAEDVEAAKEVVMATRDSLLDIEQRTLRVQVIKTGAEDMMDFIVRPPTLFDPRNSVTIGTSDVSTDPQWTFFEGGVVGAFFDAQWELDEQSCLLCIIPATASNDFAFTDLRHNCIRMGDVGIEIRPVPINVMYDTLNAKILDIPSPRSSDISEAYCSALGETLGFACPTGATKIDATTFATWPDTYPKEIETAMLEIKNVTTGDLFGWKLWRTLLAVGRMEYFLSQNVMSLDASHSHYGHVVCPMGAYDCTVYDAIRATREAFKARSPELVEQVNKVFAIVNHYVDNVTIGSMSSIVTDAYDVVEGANCQFEGTALYAAAVMPLCTAVFPAVAATSIVTAVLAVVLAVLAHHLLKWYHYLVDLEQLHAHEQLGYGAIAESTAAPDTAPQTPLTPLTTPPATPSVPQSDDSVKRPSSQSSDEPVVPQLRIEARSVSSDYAPVEAEDIEVSTERQGAFARAEQHRTSQRRDSADSSTSASSTEDSFLTVGREPRSA